MREGESLHASDFKPTSGYAPQRSQLQSSDVRGKQFLAEARQQQCCFTKCWEDPIWQALYKPENLHAGKNELYKEGFTNWQWQRGRVYMLTYIRNRKCNGISFACKSWASQKDCSNLVSLGGNAKFKGNESLSINLSEMWIKLAMPTCSSQRSPTAALRKDIPRLKHQTVTTIIERTPSIF